MAKTLRVFTHTDFTTKNDELDHGELDQNQIEIWEKAKTAGAYTLGAITDDATQTEMFVDFESDSPTRLVIPEDAVWLAEIDIIGVCTDMLASPSPGGLVGDSYARKILCHIKNIGGAILMPSGFQEQFISHDDVNWETLVQLDDTNDAMVIKVTGEADKDIRWTAIVRISELDTIIL